MEFKTSEHLADTLLPHHITLCIVIKDFSLLTNATKDLWKHDLRGRRLLDRALLGWISLPDIPSLEIVNIVKKSSSSLYQRFLASINEINNLHNQLDLQDFLDNLMKILMFGVGAQYVHKRSLLGIFCRRTQLLYKKLLFEDLHGFLIDLKKYFDRENPKTANQTNDAIVTSSKLVSMRREVEDMELESHSELDSKSSGGSFETDLKPTDLKVDSTFPPVDYEKLEMGDHMTRTQADNFFLKQSTLIKAGHSSALSPALLQKQIRDMLQSNPKLTLGHFLSYLNNLRVSEYSGAMDSLLLYFIRHDKVQRPDIKCDTYFGDDNWIERFATLNLALLHMNFGHLKEALSSVKAATSHAQLTCDWDCLTHATSYLHHLQPDKQQHKLVEEVIQPAILNQDHSLAYHVIQSFLSRRATKGCKPKLIFEALTATDSAFSNQSLTFYHQSIKSRFDHKASLWRLYGKRCMARIYCQLSMFSRIDGRKLIKSPNGFNNEEVLLSQCLLADLMDEDGYFEASNVLLEDAKINHPLDNGRLSQFWRKTEALINHRNCLKLNKFSETVVWEDVLASISSQEAEFLRAESLAARNEKMKAKLKLVKLLKEDIKPELKSKIFLLLAQIHSSCRRISTSIKYLLDSINISVECYLGELLLQAGIKLAQLLSVSKTEVGLVCLRSLHYEVMTNGSIIDQTKFVLSVIRYLLHHCSNHSDLLLYTEQLRELMDKMEISQHLHLQRSILATLAPVYDELSRCNDISITRRKQMIELRNEMASRFQQIDHQLGSNINSNLIL